MTPLSHSKSVHHIRGSMAHSLNRNHQEANHGNAGTSEHPTQILKPACRLHFILQEIGKQQPLSQGCLHSMPLSFRSLVWSSALNTLYYPDPPQNVPPPPTTTCPPLRRCGSTGSINSSRTVVKEKTHAPSPQPEGTLSQRLARLDSVRMNLLSASRAAIKIKDRVAPSNPPLSAHKLGVVPKYLTNRKEEWAREEQQRIQSLPDPDCPPGHVKMPEAERTETLARLQQNQIELIEELNRLPVSKDTLRIRQARKDLEDRLNKIDEGIRILSKSKVFVKVST